MHRICSVLSLHPTNSREDSSRYFPTNCLKSKIKEKQFSGIVLEEIIKYTPLYHFHIRSHSIFQTYFAKLLQVWFRRHQRSSKTKRAVQLVVRHNSCLGVFLEEMKAMYPWETQTASCKTTLWGWHCTYYKGGAETLT